MFLFNKLLPTSHHDRDIELEEGLIVDQEHSYENNPETDVETDAFSNLPSEITAMIIRKLAASGDLKSVSYFAQTCKTNHAIVNDVLNESIGQHFAHRPLTRYVLFRTTHQADEFLNQRDSVKKQEESKLEINNKYLRTASFVGLDLRGNSFGENPFASHHPSRYYAASTMLSLICCIFTVVIAAVGTRMFLELNIEIDENERNKIWNYTLPLSGVIGLLAGFAIAKAYSNCLHRDTTLQDHIDLIDEESGAVTNALQDLRMKN